MLNPISRPPEETSPIPFIEGNFNRIRAHRINISPSSGLTATFNGEAITLLNLSETGIAFTAEEGKVLSFGSNGRLILGFGENRVLYDGNLRLVWRKPAENQHFHFGGKFTSHVLTESLPRALETATSLRNALLESLSGISALPIEFRTLIIEMRSFLRLAKSKLSELELRLTDSSQGTKDSIKKAVELTIAPEIIDQIKQYNQRLFDLLPSLQQKPLKTKALDLFRSELNEFLTSSPFTARALNKPLGYAGDYEMMNQIYRNEYEGASLFDQIIHKYSITEASSQSVHFRRDMLKSRFYKMLAESSGTLTFASLACGPAREVIEFLQTASVEEISRSRFILIDQDMDALLNCKRNIDHVLLRRDLSADIQYYPISAKHILEGNPLKNSQFDLLYTVGLYDYLTQPLARLLTQKLIGWLGPNGSLIIGNFHPSNPTQAISEFSVNWRLIHRTEEQMLDLIPSGSFKKYNLFADPLNIDLFLEIPAKQEI